MSVAIAMPLEKITEVCRRYHVRRLSLFGSVLRDDFTPNSDVDMLVEFDEAARVGLFELIGMELELTELMGRKVDLNTPNCLSKYFRAEVLAEAEAVYVAP